MVVSARVGSIGNSCRRQRNSTSTVSLRLGWIEGDPRPAANTMSRVRGSFVILFHVHGVHYFVLQRAFDLVIHVLLLLVLPHSVGRHISH